MPIHRCIVHHIDKKPDGSPSQLTQRQAELSPSNTLEYLLSDLNDSYNSKSGKAWGYFHADHALYPLSLWLHQYLNEQQDFVCFTQQAASRLQQYMDTSNLSTGGHVLFVHYQQGSTDYLSIALLHHSEGIRVSEDLDLCLARHLDFSQLHLAARINLSEWQHNAQSRQYISFLKGRNGKKVSEYFRDFIGCEEGLDVPAENKALLQAFSEYVDEAALPKAETQEKTTALLEYANHQARQGQPLALRELSEAIDEAHPTAFYEHLRQGDYGLAAEIPPDQRTLNQFKRFTGRAEGVSVSFEAHLLGSRVEYDEVNDTLIIRQPPSQLTRQLKKSE